MVLLGLAGQLRLGEVCPVEACRAEVRHGKAVVDWYVEFGRVEVMRVAARQSCLGVVRRGAVMFGEVRQSGYVLVMLG